MAETFDPFYTWLGIAPEEQPADFYRLLGIKQFEDNREVISHASDQRMSHVRSFQNGPNGDDSQRVLNELSKAAGCLLNPRRKAMYDQHLQSSAAATSAQQAMLPPQPILTPTITVQTSATRTGAKPPPRPKSRGSRVAIGIGAGTVVVALVAWVVTAMRGTSPVAVPIAESTPMVQPPAMESHPKATIETTPALETLPTPGTVAAKFAPDAPPAIPAVAVAPVAPANSFTAKTSKPPIVVAAIPAGQPKALHFAGTDRVEIANTVGLVDPRKPFTIELWVRFAPEVLAHWIAGDLIIGSKHPDVPMNVVSGWQLFIQQTEKNQHRIAFSTRTGFSKDVPVVTSAWRHIAVCNDASRTAVWVDGRMYASGASTALQGAFAPSPIPIHIGSHGYMDAQQPNGLVGDVRAFRVSSTGRYTVNFTPETDFTTDESTEVLLDFNGLATKTLADLSGHDRAATVLGASWLAIEKPTPLVAPTTGSAPLASSSAPPVREEKPLAIPDAATLTKARDQVRSVLKDEFAKAKESQELLALTDKLLKLASDSADDHSARFALMEEAYKHAAQAGDLLRSLAILQDFARRFEVDLPKLKAAAVTKVAEVAKTNTDRRRLAEEALRIVEELTVAGEFEFAAEVAQAATSAATRAKESELTKAARDARDDVAQTRKELVEARKAEAQLATDPNNAALNLRWGRFVCFHQRNWNIGLPHLAKGSQPKLAAVARLDLANPTDSEHQNVVGQSWADAAKSLEIAERPAVTMRALHWLRLAENQAKGLARAEVEKKIKELEAGLPPRFRFSVAKAPGGKPAAPAFQPPREFVGMLGRVQVNNVDVGVLWKYEAGLRLTNQSVLDVLTQANIPRGKVRVEFVGVIQVPESTTINVGHSGGTANGTVALAVDNKPIGEVGGQRANSDVYKLDLNAGEHSIHWLMTGDDVGNCSLVFTNAATAQPLAVYHTQALLAAVRETPTRARLNVNMLRN